VRAAGPQGRKFVQLGGTREVDLDQDVKLSEDAFELALADAVVTLTLDPAARDKLAWHCTACRDACEHVGAAFSLVLEEKMSLGLAAPPPERVPVESLSEGQLVRQALADRQERARTEKMRVRSADPGVLWTDYTVTNAVSGKTYRVALRGWEAGECYCTCPDFRSNTLGVCKHILHVQEKVAGRFQAAERNRPYVHRDTAVAVRYGSAVELRLLLPEKLSAEGARILSPVRDRPIQDAHDLALAALDADSPVDAMQMVSGIEEMRRRLEVLLGAKPAAPEDDRQAAAPAAQAEALRRRERVAAAGGQLLTAALGFLGELLPAREPAAEGIAAGGDGELVRRARAHLEQCIERDEAGRLKLTVALPDETALDTMAASLARVLALG